MRTGELVMRSGTVIGDRFAIEHLAGTGGMGAVYRARDDRTGAAVALKLLRSAGSAEEDRFAREIRVLAQLEHPGVVRYVAHGATTAGEPYLVMEWLDGEDLARRLSRAPLPIDQSLSLVRKVAEALGAVHALGVVHRDIKPSNLFLPGGEVDLVKILDFGIARVSDATLLMTGTGHVLGTPAYMAPEQARGDREISARADVYALGCVLFECLIGRPPFEGTHPLAVLAKILIEDPPRLRELRADVPVEIERLVARLLSKDPGARPADGAQLVADLAGMGDEGAPASLRAAPALSHGEQRLVSVLLAGVAAEEGARTLTPEELDTPLSRLQAIAARFDVRLERLRDGSAVGAILGQGSATDQAARAARYALEVRGAWPEAAIVLATGPGVLKDRLPVGEVIDRAASLLADAARAQERSAQDEGRPVYLDDVTAGLLEGRFELEAAEGGRVLLGEREAAADTARTLLGRPTPCVGRDRELATLEATLAECIDDSVARAVLVTGPAGVGKSRVRHELLRALRRRDDFIEIWTASCDSMRADSPFDILAQILGSAAGVSSGEPPEARRDALKARVVRHVPPEDAARVAGLLNEIMGGPSPSDARGEIFAIDTTRFDPAPRGHEIRLAWEDFLTSECTAHPILIVIDDLHWGDHVSIQLLDAALRTQRERPLMVLALARPDVHDRFSKLWAERDVQEIRLGELSRKASARLVRQVLGDAVDAAAADRLAARAGGNAFYLEELIRAHAAGQGDEPPGTVLAMVQARLSALPAEARRIIRAASIFGEVFPEAGVGALLGTSEGEALLAAWISTLVDRELVVRPSGSGLSDQREHAFRHALVREAAYAMLTDDDRVLGHRLAGAWLEQSGEADEATVAEQFERANERERAIALYEQAMKRALEMGTPDAALAHAKRAIACGAEGPQLGTIRAMQADAHVLRNDFTESERCFRDATVLLPIDDPRWLECSVGSACIASGVHGDHEPLETMAEQLCRGDAARLSPQLLNIVTLNLLSQGRRRAAAPLLDRLDAALRAAATHPLAVAEMHQSFAARALMDGNPVEARAAAEAAITAAESIGAIDDAHRRLLACSDIELGAYAEAENVFVPLISLLRRRGQRRTEASVSYHLARARLQQCARPAHLRRGPPCLRRTGGRSPGPDGRPGPAPRHRSEDPGSRCPPPLPGGRPRARPRPRARAAMALDVNARSTRPSAGRYAGTRCRTTWPEGLHGSPAQAYLAVRRDP